MNISQWKDIIGIITSIVQIIALIIGSIVGAYWSYWLLTEKRELFPRAKITHQITAIFFTNDELLLRVKETICNSGNTLLELFLGEIWINQLLPFQADVYDDVRKWKNIDNIEKGQRGPEMISWPVIGFRQWLAQRATFEIEPQQCEDRDYDFTLNAEVQIIQIYSWIKNIDKDFIGWNMMTIHDLQSLKEDQNAARKMFRLQPAHPTGKGGEP
jgi:hypothetical protein